MGYTHYFEQKKHANTEQWGNITTGFKKLQAAALLTQAFPIQREEDDPTAPEVTNDQIIFNGIGDDAHETLMLERENSGFQFCKTAGKP